MLEIKDMTSKII